ncbi:putative alginate O-acetylase AlgI [Deltaproteobacteria bacterium]|nr:putative alginate O-acetylase AlgI [Deltaproteobacteria bacterium]
MLFISDEFFVFLVLALLGAAVAPSARIRVWLLVGFCVWFYASWSLPFMGLLAANIVADYFLALGIHRSGSALRRCVMVTASVTMNLGMLGVFKYAGFAASTTNDVLHLLGTGVALPVPHLLLPLGISFYVFQAISYTVDVYRGLLDPTRNLRKLATFILFFPHLVSGPIVRAAEILPQLDRLERPPTLDDLTAGAKDFVIGFARKVVFADAFAQLADATFDHTAAYGSLNLWIGLFAYALQIYFDFSGYSQMAVGLARMFGIHFPDNFDSPYIARSLQEFWRRWHISLSRFLRDYLYIPLGGSRHGTGRTLFAMSATMLIGGFWHGANWTFVVWGAIHGFGQAGAWLYRERFRTAHAAFWDSPLGNFAGWTLTMTTVMVAWVFFRSLTLGASVDYLSRMFAGEAGTATLGVSSLQFGLFGAAVALHLVAYLRPQAQVPWPKAPFLQGLAVGAAYFGCVAVKQADAPFIYFNF